MKGSNSRDGLYSMIGRVYDIFDYPSELMYYKPMRQKWISKIKDELVLELGVGTGKNLPYYHQSNRIIGLDREQNMLTHAANRMKKNNVNSNISLTLQKEIPWKMPKNMFSQIVATFVFYTMADPRPVLSELLRWVKKDTKLLIFEYVRPKNPHLRSIIKYLNPITSKLFGVDFNRKPTHHFLRDEWEIIKKTDIINNFLIVIEAIKI